MGKEGCRLFEPRPLQPETRLCLAQAVERCWSGRHTTFPRDGPGLLGLLGAFPAAEPHGVEPHMPCGFGNTVALHRHEADGLTRERCRRGVAFLDHHWTPPLPIFSLFSKCPFLLNHNNMDP